MIDIIIKMSLALVMFVVGLAITNDDMKTLFKSPMSLFVGLFFQMILLPCIALAIAFCIPENYYVKVGLIILALCPGGTTSNFLCYLLGLRIPLSIGLTAINSVLIVFSLPLGTSFAFSFFAGEKVILDFPSCDFIVSIIKTMILPLFCGFLINIYFNKYSEKIGKLLKTITVIFFALAFIIKFLASEEQGGSGIEMIEVFNILPYTLMLLLFTFFITLYLANKIGINNKDKLTLCIEVGLQNVPLALMVSSILIGNEDLAKPALVYSLFSFPLILFLSWVYKVIYFD